jgi:hypothetical protein
MANKDFGLKGIRFVGDFGTPKITSPIGVDINATKVAISTDATIGRDLSVTGISTLGGIKLSSGVVQSATGVAVTFIGNLTGNASTATTSTNIGSGNTGSLPYQSDTGLTTFLSAPGATDQVLVFNDDTQQPSWAKVELGTNTSGNYVKELTGTAGEIVLTPSGVGAGATHTISLAENPTIQGSLEVKQNLNVLGNITIGGTTNNLNIQDLLVVNKDIILGVTTTGVGSGTDVSTDFTANGGGIAIASTEGSPLVNLNNEFEPNPNTYKKIMWFGAAGGPGGTAFPTLAVDAWLSNYAFGIGTTVMSVGTRFAAGNVQISNNDITAVRNINASGITTVGTGNTGIVINGTDGTIKSLGTTTVTLTGNLTGTATTATNLTGGAQGSLPYQNSAGITSFVGAASTDNQILLYNTGTGKPYWGNISDGAGSGSVVSSDQTNAVKYLTYVGNYTGVTSSFGVDENGLAYNPSTNRLGIGTTGLDYTLTVQGDVKITGAIRDSNSGIGTSNQILTSDGAGGWSWENFTAVGAIGGVTINDNTASTPQYLLFTSATEGEISSQNVSSTNLVYSPTSGNLGIGTTLASERLQVQGNISINGNTSYGAVTASTAGITTTAIYSGLSTSTYRSVEFTIQATQGTNYHVTKILSFHDGSIAYNSEYGMMYNNESVGAFDVDISGGNIRLLVTPASASSTTYTVNFIATKI